MIKYHGASRAKLDDRGRLYLPNRWSEGSQDKEMVLTAGPSKSLWLLDKADWEEVVGHLDAAILCSHRTRLQRALLVGYAETVTPDKQGRIQLSEPLRHYGGLEELGQAFLVGTGRVIEIWAKAQWELEMAAAAGDPLLFDSEPGEPREGVRIPATTT